MVYKMAIFSNHNNYKQLKIIALPLSSLSLPSMTPVAYDNWYTRKLKQNPSGPFHVPGLPNLRGQLNKNAFKYGTCKKDKDCHQAYLCSSLPNCWM